MVNTPIGRSYWKRDVAQTPSVTIRNRFFETNPTDQITQTSMISRPGLRRWKALGDGPIRGLYSQPGSFDDALFAVSGADLYRVDTDNSARVLFAGLFGGDTTSFASMSATAAIGSTPEMLYIADGQKLRLYTQTSVAVSELLITTTILSGEVVRLGSLYYEFTSGGVDAGAPAGTSGNPWLVKLGADVRESLENLLSAINGTGTPGITYSTGLIANSDAYARASTATALSVQASVAGLAGNNIVTTTTIAGGAWSGATLGGGAGESVSIVDLPDGLPAISVGFIAGYTIVVPGPVPGFKGRFFWIKPGETSIDPLSFATAERSPDPLYAVRVVGDQFWLFGTNTTEIWYPTGDLINPFQRVQGQVFDRGIVQGTDVQIRNSVVVVDRDGVVYKLSDGSPDRISNHSTEEQIRKAIRADLIA